MTNSGAMLDLEPAARRVKTVVAAISDAQLSNPTPCADTSVAALLDHFMGLSRAFTNAALKQTNAPGQSGPPQSSAEHLDPAWRTRLPEQIDELVTAWRDTAAWQGETMAGGITLPAEVMGVVALDELVIHGWDLARAIGLPFECDSAHAEAIIGMLSQLPGNREGTGFGPIVDVSPGAPPLYRAVGLSGRDPGWTP